MFIYHIANGVLFFNRLIVNMNFNTLLVCSLTLYIDKKSPRSLHEITGFLFAYSFSFFLTLLQYFVRHYKVNALKQMLLLVCFQRFLDISCISCEPAYYQPSVRYLCIELAATRPAPMARITVAAPVTMSPPAQTPGLVVLALSSSVTI